MAFEDSPIRIKSFQFVYEIVIYSDYLKSRKDFEIASQFLKSGTSIGANTREPQGEVLAKKILKINLA